MSPRCCRSCCSLRRWLLPTAITTAAIGIITAITTGIITAATITIIVITTAVTTTGTTVTATKQAFASRGGGVYVVTTMKPLPPTFALNCPNDCWLVVAPHNDRPGGRTFERQHLHPADSGALTIPGDDVPIVPQLPPARRPILRRSGRS